MKHYNQQIALYLQLAIRSFGMTVDKNGWPPSNRGLVKSMQRHGLLIKKRIPKSKKCFRSIMFITEKGKEWLRKRKPKFKAWSISEEDYIIALNS